VESASFTQTFEVVTSGAAGGERSHRYTAPDGLRTGQVLRLSGRFWLVREVVSSDAGAPRAIAVPARYRLTLTHPDGRVELGAVRRFRTDGPRLGHAFTTVEDGKPVSWHVVDERVERDASGEAYLDLLAERDFAEVEDLPDHELEHALARLDERLPAEAFARLLQATAEGLAYELVALEPGEAPDWDEARHYIDALVVDEIEDDLLELCGVDPNADPRETWLATARARLGSDLDRFRADIEGAHVGIEEWDFLEGRIFASVGTFEDEANPDSGHGWMCRLLDAGALGASGFSRVRRTEL